MIIPLSYPLRFFYDLKSIYKSDEFFMKSENLALEKPDDKRFLIFKYLKKYENSSILKLSNL